MTIIDDALSTFPQFASYNQMLIQSFCENCYFNDTAALSLRTNQLNRYLHNSRSRPIIHLLNTNKRNTNIQI